MRWRLLTGLALPAVCVIALTAHTWAQRAASESASADRLARIGQMLDRRIAVIELPPYFDEWLGEGPWTVIAH